MTEEVLFDIHIRTTRAACGLLNLSITAAAFAIAFFFAAVRLALQEDALGIEIGAGAQVRQRGAQTRRRAKRRTCGSCDSLDFGEAVTCGGAHAFTCTTLPARGRTHIDCAARTMPASCYRRRARLRPSPGIARGW
jgi:hypothetical protein